MGRTRKSQHTSLGKSLVKKNTKGWDMAERGSNLSDRHTHADPTTALKSVTEETSYEEFIATAALADREFTAEKLNVKFVALSTADPLDDGSNYLTEEEIQQVVVPRRPQWTKEMTPEELDEAEKVAFLNWRRHMAQLQEKDGITPFERNIEVWRQLWRVLDRSEVIIQIVDARNPLLYRCEDLEVYVKELGKNNILLVNKADFLTEEQRIHWTAYFDSIHLEHAYYSAAAAAAALKRESISEEDDQESSSADEEDSDEEGSDESDREKASTQIPAEQQNSSSNCTSPKAKPILTREQLIEYFKGLKKEGADLLTVGLVGYPNVGKSSTINSLMASKKTSVSATPGKTKHFQTLFLEEDVLLCDCPGLVMPSFGGSQGEMVLGGILPIDTLTNYAQAVALLALRIPKSILEYTYGITLPKDFNHDDFLNSYASIRGFMTVRGLPDCARASRIVLKDYVNGKLNYCHAPPNLDQTEFHPAPTQFTIHGATGGDGTQSKRERQLLERHFFEELGKEKPTTIRKPNVERSLDGQFFRPNVQTVHFKGKLQVPSGLSATSASVTSSGNPDKPWRKTNNKKREKLRRVYRHLDVE